MPEWTLCADLKVYARQQSPAKPATRPDPQTLVDHEVTERHAMIDAVGGPRTEDVGRHGLRDSGPRTSIGPASGADTRHSVGGR
ncbi:hypothetical protein GA0070612_1937 [Micromonospora chokoriensis]|uniref:Uncharacterized protein n=1 Tax=Micromonospora chokoriensis TaxID=356851 RepID=A0A1C4VZ44_9ACTN|nr:hypothetical protein GA0070612_1937 [Micromonospora chokoriensis]